MKKSAVLFMIISAICGYSLNAYSADILTSGTCGVSAQACSYTVDSEGLLHIYGNGKIGDGSFASWTPVGKNFTINNIVIGKGITEIGGQAFQSLREISNVSIPNTVTSIGYNAFYNVSLESIVIPKSVKTIGPAAFLYSGGLRDVTIEGSDVQIGDGAFFATGITHYANDSSKVTVKAGSLTEQRMKTITSSKVTYDDIPNRRIYTIQEATDALGDHNKNTFSITYQ